MMEKPSVVVVGAGGMGALFGAILLEGGLAVTLVDTNAEHVAAMKKYGLKITGFGGDRAIDVDARETASYIDQADIILFQCKSHGTRDAASGVRHLVDKGAVCVSFQNGLGNEEVISEVVGAENVLGGLTAMAAVLEGPGLVRDFSRVPSSVGEMGGGDSARAEAIAKAFTAAGLETHVTEDVRRDIWKKLLGNIAMSAASGATDMTSVEVLSVPELKATAFRALDEAFAVATAQGIDLDHDAAVAGLEMITAPGGTGDNKSSLCVDLLNGRPTEVDFIYGSVIELGRKSGVPTPTLETLASIVKGLEARNRGNE